MRIVSFDGHGQIRVGLILQDGRVLDLAAAAKVYQSAVDPSVFTSTIELFGTAEGMDEARRLLDAAESSIDSDVVRSVAWEAPRLFAPVPKPPRLRDYLTSGQHAANLKMPLQAALEQMPVCYQGNHLGVIGPDAEIPWPSYSKQLDYELEPAIVVGCGGRNISVDDALPHIAGMTILNDVSARDIQGLEMSSSVGPSKGKHFANVIGPCVATLDEFDIDEWRLESRINGEVWGGPKQWHADYGIAQVTAWASWHEDLVPGEVLGLGTVAQGCGLEIGRWIQPGDTVELEMEGVGVLRNVVGRPGDDVPVPLSTYRGAPRFDPAGKG